jgi:hypothetical protein
MVRVEGVEPPRVSPLEPKSSASTSSATLARVLNLWDLLAESLAFAKNPSA